MLGLSTSGLIDKFANRLSGMETSFTLKMPDGAERLLGSGAPKFEIALNNNRAVKAMGSLDEGNIGEAYLQGDFDELSRLRFSCNGAEIWRAAGKVGMLFEF